MQRYDEVMARVSRGELTPTILQDLMPSFVEARGASYAAELAELSMKFFSGLVELGTTYSSGLVEAVTPGVAVDGATPQMPPLDPADWSGWFQQLTDYAGQHGATAVGAYQALLDQVAAGEVPPTQLQQASTRYIEEQLPEQLRLLVRLCFELLNGLNDIRTRYSEEYLDGVLATTAGPEADPAPFALDLVAPLGEMASASITVSNTRDEPSVIACSVSDVRRSDGVGPAFRPDLALAPQKVELAAGEEVALTISILLRPPEFEPGPMYVGAARVSGRDDVVMEVPLRIRATPAAIMVATSAE